MVEMEELKGKRKGTCSLSHEDANLESVNELQSPPRARFKVGQTDCKCLKEEETKALNELNLFDAASVVGPNSSQYQRRVMNYQFRQPAVGDNFLGPFWHRMDMSCDMGRPPITTNGLNSKQVQEGNKHWVVFHPEWLIAYICVSALRDTKWTFDKVYRSWALSVHTASYSLVRPSSYVLTRVFALSPSCVAASSWLESVKPRLNDGIGPSLGIWSWWKHGCAFFRFQGWFWSAAGLH
ncbi:hypothetical protein Ahy_A05g023169 isoform A [Arachis hypogaea]|uniref:Uncharacterized protein n=1 Tax=Arachis hypogaea TaxID=3818 RepID=A0A445D2Q0_ARAHY|nr:hypothetical protein Ahy_A05g023169 isoform A [Arachis hypogaea]